MHSLLRDVTTFKHNFLTLPIAKICGPPSLEYANAYVINETEIISSSTYGTIHNVGCQIGWEWSNSSFRDEALEINCDEHENWTALTAFCQRIFAIFRISL